MYDKRFELRRQDGFAYLEKIMEGKEPSCSYSVLAQILEKWHNNVVITTNFDNLTEDALFIYTNKKPLVIGTSTLADFISTNLSRPLIVKIHHDLFLSPKNSEGDIKKLEEGFVNNLGEIFEYYTPLVIGYGGNDGSLMNFLKEPNYNGNYANFLNDIKKDYDNAEKHYLKALEIEPDNFNVNYLKLLIITKKIEESKNIIYKALEIYKKGNIEIDATIELYFYMYVPFPKDFPESKNKIEEMLSKGIKSIGWVSAKF